MANWFYLYLYTEDKPQFTDYITATISKISHIRKDSKNMGCRLDKQNNICIDEGTSHWIDVTVKNDDGTDMDLTGCTAVFTAGARNIEDKSCLIENNHINVKLEPSETIGFLASGYQIRIFDSNGDVFQVIQGYINIRKAHKPYIQNPLNEGGQR